MCLSWLVVFHVLSIRPYLVEDGVDPVFFPKERFRATLGVVLYAIARVAGCLRPPDPTSSSRTRTLSLSV
jgi:hypothetical protein